MVADFEIKLIHNERILNMEQKTGVFIKIRTAFILLLAKTVQSQQGDRAQYKECMMKKLFMMLCGVVFAIVISGCASGATEPDPFILIEEGGDRIALEVEILNKRENNHAVWKPLWRDKAVLYLKIYDKKNPEISLLYPLNVERKDSGNRKLSVITPFEYGTPTVLVVELLVDYLDDEEEELLVEAARTGAMIVCDASQAYKISKTEADAIFRNKDRIASLATSGAKVLAKNLNQHRSDTLDIYEYTFNKGGIFLSKAFTILNNDNKHCDLKFYFVE